ncbi:hypothetical protein FHW19_003500 [Ochrobactrum anthropi]|nr:hypothetical protein [Brucella anthropi]
MLNRFSSKNIERDINRVTMWTCGNELTHD